MEYVLRASDDEIIRKLQNLQNHSDVASLVEVPNYFLAHILQGAKEREKYYIFNIKKKSQHDRLISSPPKNIAILQKKLLHALSLLYKPKIPVHGFCRGRSIVSNSGEHTSRKHVLNIDLDNFFPSIHIGRVIGLFKSHPYRFGNAAAVIIAQICTPSNGVLPQGAPTSPLISNLICRSLDNVLIQLAKKYHCTYTRYADDITFSSTRSFFPKSLAQDIGGKIVVGKKLEDVISKHDFRINIKKVRIQTLPARQEVTGLTVNEFPNVRRTRIRALRAAIYAWNRHGYEQAERIYLKKYYGKWSKSKSLNSAIHGHISYIGMVRGESDPVYRRIVHDYNILVPKKITLGEIETVCSYPLRGGQPRDDVWKTWIKKYENSIVFLEIKNREGDKRTGTGFYIGNGAIITAGHNLIKNLSINNMWAGGKKLKLSNTNCIFEEGGLDVGIISVNNSSSFTGVWLPCHFRMPEVGEEVAAIGFPVLPQRLPSLVLHTGIVEALPVNYKSIRCIQVSFHSGGGLSGGPLLDKRGNVIGIMIENIYQSTTEGVPSKPFGQAIPIEYSAPLTFK